ncbi:hypothetical protein [Saccharibacillus sacchari]|uniref:Uncharacterized protein n=1 Tax=Saccharibacillus sacchari TaxID=456493 RepID=A0ACC6PIC7_9BACL
MALTDKIPPEWNAPGIEPPDSKKDTGFEADDLVPAGWLNWFMAGVSAFLQDAQENGASTAWVQEQINKIAIPLIDSNTSTSKTSAPTADALRRTVESMAEALGLKQNTIRLADNYLAASVLVNAAADSQGRVYPDGFSFFKVSSSAGAWPTANGYVVTMRAGSGGFQLYFEMYTGVTQTDKTARFWTRSKRDSNAFWQDWTRMLTEVDLLDYVRQPGYAVTAGTGAAYTAALNPQPAVLVDGLSITIVPHTANTAADPTLKIGTLGALPIRRQSGGTFAAGTIKAGAPLSLVKVGSYFLARSAPAIGTATAAQVLAGSTFQSEAVPDGGSGTIPVRSGIVNATGAAQWGDGQLAVYLPDGYYPVPGSELRVSVAQIQAADGDLVAANIRTGVNIFGVVGTLEPRSYTRLTLTIPANSRSAVIDLGFAPSSITLTSADSGDFFGVTYVYSGASLQSFTGGRLTNYFLLWNSAGSSLSDSSTIPQQIIVANTSSSAVTCIIKAYK